MNPNYPFSTLFACASASLGRSIRNDDDRDFARDTRRDGNYCFDGVAQNLGRVHRIDSGYRWCALANPLVVLDCFR